MYFFLPLSKVEQAKIRYLDDKTAVNNTVGRLQVAMRMDLRAMQVGHTLEKFTET